MPYSWKRLSWSIVQNLHPRYRKQRLRADQYTRLEIQFTGFSPLRLMKAMIPQRTQIPLTTELVLKARVDIQTTNSINHMLRFLQRGQLRYLLIAYAVKHYDGSSGCRVR